MMIDKGYYDYDYEPVPPKQPKAKKKDSKKVIAKFAGDFGHSKLKSIRDIAPKETDIERAERLQREVNEHLKTHTNGR